MNQDTISEATKLCIKCQTVRPCSDFHKYHGSKDGHYTYCKICQKTKRKADTERYKALGRTLASKVCSKCGEEKPATDFHKRSTCSTGLTNNCKACLREQNLKHYHTRIEKLRQWARDNPELDKQNRRARYFKSKFGITLAERDALIESQGGRCAICDQVPVPSSKPLNGSQGVLCIDHCHKTGKVRGLLCSRCNTSIGQFEDSEELLARAIEYLRKHKT